MNLARLQVFEATSDASLGEAAASVAALDPTGGAR